MSEINNYQNIEPIGAHFRLLPIDKSFTWVRGIPIDKKERYGVHFFSLRNPEATANKIKKLLDLDGEATVEAQAMPGYGTYWHDDDLFAGIVGSSWCLWEDQQFAKQAARQPKHKEAMLYTLGEGKTVYNYFEVTGYVIRRPFEKITFEPVYHKVIGDLIDSM